MTSFQIIISPSRRAAAQYVNDVRRELQKAYVEAKNKTGITQSEIAREIGVHRSVISRQLRGREDISLGRVAEFAYVLGLEPHFELRAPNVPMGVNIRNETSATEINITPHPDLITH